MSHFAHCIDDYFTASFALACSTGATCASGVCNRDNKCGCAAGHKFNDLTASCKGEPMVIGILPLLVFGIIKLQIELPSLLARIDNFNFKDELSVHAQCLRTCSSVCSI